MASLESFATASTGSSVATALSWSHVPNQTASATYGFVQVAVRGSFTNLTATWGGTPMGVLGTQTDGTSPVGVQLKLFGLSRPLAGSQLIAVNSTDGTGRIFVGGSALFYRVAIAIPVGSPVGAGGTNKTNLSVRVKDSEDDGLVVAGLVTTGLSSGLISSNATVVYTAISSNATPDNNPYTGFLYMAGVPHGNVNPQFNWTTSNRAAMIGVSLFDGPHSMIPGLFGMAR